MAINRRIEHLRKLGDQCTACVGFDELVKRGREYHAEAEELNKLYQKMYSPEALAAMDALFDAIEK
jgi:hypothetical protein